jgi:hypothetical protein
LATFVHHLEDNFAAMLDSFNIDYEYEPTLFPIEMAKNGNVLKGFAPDFYIPELDLYVEITSMNGSYCSRKRRKIEQVKEMYDIDTVLIKKPEINILLQKFLDGDLHREKLCAILLNCDEETIQQLV